MKILIYAFILYSRDHTFRHLNEKQVSYTKQSHSTLLFLQQTLLYTIYNDGIYK